MLWIHKKMLSGPEKMIGTQLLVKYRLPHHDACRSRDSCLPHIMPKRKLNAVRLREPVHGKRALTLDREMNQECSICLEQFWDPTCIIGCPADVCNALMCSHCAVKQHGLGVMRNSARTTEVHTCFSCRNDRHSVGEKGVPVSDPTPPRQGMHLRTLTRYGATHSLACAPPSLPPRVHGYVRWVRCLTLRSSGLAAMAASAAGCAGTTSTGRPARSALCPSTPRARWQST